MQNSLFIQLIADYGVGDPSFSEVVQKLRNLAPNAVIQTTSVSSFSTIATGFWTLQFAIENPVLGMLIYTNTAPRKDKKTSREQNEGEKLVYAKLENGVTIVGVNAGYCFSFVKPQIKDLHLVNVANKGSQFRSRDFYPEAVAGIAAGNRKFMGEALDPVIIPEVPGFRVASIDGYGNIKTTVRLSTVTFSSGQVLSVVLNGMKRTAYFTNGTFSVREGELAFAPGSSGGKIDPFMELFMRYGSAHQEFGKPKVEMEFTVTKA